MSPRDARVTRVIFRRWRSGHRDVIALFPDLKEGGGLVAAYQHIGQHAAAAPGCIGRTVPVSLEEPDVAALKREIEARGYNLEVIQRWPRD